MSSVSMRMRPTFKTFNADEIVESTIQRSSQIATLPAVALQIIQLCDHPETTIDDLYKVIIVDPVLGIRILKLVNSAFYGLRGQVKTIKHAILMLGLKAVRNLAIAASLVKLVRGSHVGLNFKASDLWTHSIAVATGAQMLAKRSNLVTSDEAFLAGLIHDIGIVVEFQTNSMAFAQLINKLDQDETLTFRSAEEQVLGASHEELGAGLCKTWNFPESLQLSTGYHHRYWELDDSQRILPGIVHLADLLAARLRLGYSRTVESDLIDLELLDCTNLTVTDIKEVEMSLRESMLESQRLLSNNHSLGSPVG